MDEQTINVVNVYAPNTDTERRTFFLILELFISRENIIGGDFNFIMDNRLGKLGGDPNSRQAQLIFCARLMSATICVIFGGNGTRMSGIIRGRAV